MTTHLVLLGQEFADVGGLLPPAAEVYLWCDGQSGFSGCPRYNAAASYKYKTNPRRSDCANDSVLMPQPLMPVLAARTGAKTLASSLEVPSVAEAWSTAWTRCLITSSRCAVIK